MTQNIEIEFKNIITIQEFEKIKKYFQIHDDQFSSQINHYFDTADFALKQQGCALRIRFKNGTYELTLKQPYGDGLLETTETLDSADAEKLLQNGKIKNKTIYDLIAKMHINPDNIRCFGSLKTDRAEFEYKQGLMVLDHSFYLNKEDYEIEYEVNNKKEGQSAFLAFLKQLEIPIRATENKIKRFFNEKYKQQARF